MCVLLECFPIKPLLNSSIQVQKQPETTGECAAGKTSHLLNRQHADLVPGVTVYLGKLWVLSDGRELK